MRLYHVVVVNDKTKTKSYQTTYPMSHEECCIMLSKMIDYPSTRKMLEEFGEGAATTDYEISDGFNPYRS